MDFWTNHLKNWCSISNLKFNCFVFHLYSSEFKRNCMDKWCYFENHSVVNWEQKRFSKAPNSQLEFQPHIASFIKYLADQLSFD